MTGCAADCPRTLPAALRTILPRLAPGADPGALVSCRSCSGSNAVYRLGFAHGDDLIVKIASHPELVRGFAPERTAARLARQAGLLAPDHLPAVSAPDAAPGGITFVAYPRIGLPTLADLWPRLSWQRPGALTSWGALMRCLHEIRLPGAGPLPQAVSGSRTPSAFLGDDLERRLGRAVRAGWPEGVPALEKLGEAVGRRSARLDARGVVLNHGDLFAPNLLCEADGPVRCVGLLDLEDALAAPPEADLARTELLHGPLFGNPLPQGWFDLVLAGYGGDVDRGLIALFRAYHLLNMAYHCAITGNPGYAGVMAEDLVRGLDAGSLD
ncbi:aminoglycoside phosphotransferase family protein [Arenibaculum sp.]|uniref:phosphotransferase family protein n=1 Tax=Arenibaculum sp. TaxID=2865862 RepID=UPI002E0F198B|nr:aminoglycoside phosphotransferase family protein [Arenibaculum sp.]